MYDRLEVEFESNVILDRYKTGLEAKTTDNSFESNVILDRYKTLSKLQSMSLLV